MLCFLCPWTMFYVSSSQVVCLAFRECAHQSRAAVNPTPSFLIQVSFKRDTFSSCGGILHSFVSAVQNGVSKWLTTVLTEKHIKKEKEDCRLKRPRGRPPKLSREQSSSIYGTSKKSKHGKKVYSQKLAAWKYQEKWWRPKTSSLADSYSTPRHSPVGIHQGHPHPPREEPRSTEVGGPSRGRLQVPQVGGGGSDVGSEEEEQQHDLRETQPCHEVIWCSK